MSYSAVSLVLLLDSQAYEVFLKNLDDVNCTDLSGYFLSNSEENLRKKDVGITIKPLQVLPVKFSDNSPTEKIILSSENLKGDMEILSIAEIPGTLKSQRRGLQAILKKNKSNPVPFTTLVSPAIAIILLVLGVTAAVTALIIGLFCIYRCRQMDPDSI